MCNKKKENTQNEGVYLQWQVMHSLRRLNGEVEQYLLQPFCEQHGITPLQLHILMTLYFTGSKTISELAQNTCMAGANNSALCKKLEQDGYVHRQRATTDKRQVQVSLSVQGNALVKIFVEQCKQQMPQTLFEQGAQQTLQGVEQLTTLLQQKREEESV